MANPANDDLATDAIDTGKLWSATWTLSLMGLDWGLIERPLTVYIPSSPTTVTTTSWAQKSWFYLNLPAIDFDPGYELTWRLGIRLEAQATSSATTTEMRLWNSTYSTDANVVEPAASYAWTTIWTEGTTWPATSGGFVLFDIQCQNQGAGTEDFDARRSWGNDTDCYFQIDQG